MKKQILIAGVFLSSLIMGCTQDEALETLSNESSLSNEIKKVETLFADNMQKEKDESAYSDTDEKIETSMSLEDRLVYYDYVSRNGINPPTLSSSMTRQAGLVCGLVLKPKGVSCAPYSELIFMMDCEDHKERSYVSGNTGETFVDHNGNVHFFFCIVPHEMTYGGGLDQYNYNVTRFFDCQDTNNDNRFFINGYRQNGINHTELGITDDGRGNVTFYFNSKGSKTDSYGRFATGPDPSKSGIIYTDDEDDNNINSHYPLGPVEGWDHNTLLYVYF